MASHGPHGNTTMHRSQVRKVLWWWVMR
jgi:hypothetical protein